MGYRIRRVPPNWSHPKDTRGNFIPIAIGRGRVMSGVEAKYGDRKGE